MSDVEKNVDGEVVEQVKQTEVVVQKEPQAVVKQNYFFDDGEAQQVVEAKTPEQKTGELVNDVLNAGIVHKVKNDDGVRDRILKTSDKLINSHLSKAESKADKEDKEAFFEANKDACTYFGYDETTTSKCHVKMMKAWTWFFNTLYIMTIGFFIVAPISFFFHKIKVVIKHTWLVLVLAVLIYAAIVGTPFLVAWLEGLL